MGQRSRMWLCPKKLLRVLEGQKNRVSLLPNTLKGIKASAHKTMHIRHLGKLDYIAKKKPGNPTLGVFFVCLVCY